MRLGKTFVINKYHQALLSSAPLPGVNHRRVDKKTQLGDGLILFLNLHFDRLDIFDNELEVG